MRKASLRKTAALSFFWVYKLMSGMWRQVLYSTWGFVSECKHQPTCSEYMAQEIETEGWLGVKKGLKRLASCR